MTNKEIVAKFKAIGLLTPAGTAILYSAFKNRCTIQKYGKGRKQLKIVFVGVPNTNLFGFYVYTDTDPIVMKEAYDLYKMLINRDMTPFNDKDVQWGNCGMPTEYHNLRSV